MSSKIPLEIEQTEHRNPRIYAIFIFSCAVILLFLKNHKRFLSSVLTVKPSKYPFLKANMNFFFKINLKIKSRECRNTRSYSIFTLSRAVILHLLKNHKINLSFALSLLSWDPSLKD